MPLARQLLVGPNALAQPLVDLVSSLYLRPYDLAEAAQSHRLQIISKLNKHLYNKVFKVLVSAKLCKLVAVGRVVKLSLSRV